MQTQSTLLYWYLYSLRTTLRLHTKYTNKRGMQKRGTVEEDKYKSLVTHINSLIGCVETPVTLWICAYSVWVSSTFTPLNAFLIWNSQTKQNYFIGANLCNNKPFFFFDKYIINKPLKVKLQVNSQQNIWRLVYVIVHVYTVGILNNVVDGNKHHQLQLSLYVNKTKSIYSACLETLLNVFQFFGVQRKPTLNSIYISFKSHNYSSTITS